MFLLFGPMEIYATSYLVVSTPIKKKMLKQISTQALKQVG